MKKVIKRIAMLFVVCGLAVSVSFGNSAVKEIVMELEDIKKNREEKNLSFPYEAKIALQEGKLFLEFFEKVDKASGRKLDNADKCLKAVRDVMSDLDNEHRYGSYLWSKSARDHIGCLNLSGFKNTMKKARIELKKLGIELKSFNKDTF